MFSILFELQLLSLQYEVEIRVDTNPVVFYVDGSYVEEPYSMENSELDIAKELHGLLTLYNEDDFAVELGKGVRLNNGEITNYLI